MTRDSDSPKPVRLSDILSAMLAERGWSGVIKEHRVFSEWDGTVGAAISRNTRPLRINRGVLVVLVSSPVWTQELSLMKDEIIRRLNERLKDAVVRDIRFVQGDVQGE